MAGRFSLHQGGRDSRVIQENSYRCLCLFQCQGLNQPQYQALFSLSPVSSLLNDKGRKGKQGMVSPGLKLGLSDAIPSRGSENIPIRFCFLFFFHFMHSSVPERSSGHKENFILSRLSEYSLLMYILSVNPCS